MLESGLLDQEIAEGKAMGEDAHFVEGYVDCCGEEDGGDCDTDCERLVNPMMLKMQRAKERIRTNLEQKASELERVLP
jgi:methionyl-tRNA synthetase